MPSAKERRLGIEKRRRLRREMTVEAALAQTSGLDVRNQIARSRNGALWTSAGLGLLSGAWVPVLAADPGTAATFLVAFTVVPFIAMARRAWQLHRAMRTLDDVEDPDLTEGDDELARLEQLVSLLRTRSAKRAGRAAINAVREAYAERLLYVERRHQLVGLRRTADHDAGRESLDSELHTCDGEIADLDRHLETLITSVAHLADVAVLSQSMAIRRVRDATDAVNALASGIEEIETPSVGL